MNSKVMMAESKISSFIKQHENEWSVVCGLSTTPNENMPKILQLLRNEELYELEAMLIWRMEQIALDSPAGDVNELKPN